jgi:serine/threonine-protein kinase
MAVLLAHASQPVIPPSQIVQDVPEDLEKIVLRLLEKETSKRFADMSELEQELKQCGATGDWDSQRAAVWWHERSRHHDTDTNE